MKKLTEEKLLDGYCGQSNGMDNISEIAGHNLKLKMLKFIQDIDPDDVPPRIFGEFKFTVKRYIGYIEKKRM